MTSEISEAVKRIDDVLEICYSFPGRGQLTACQARALEAMMRELEGVRSFLCKEEQNPSTRLFGAVAWTKIIGKLAELVIEFFKDQL